MIDEHIADLAVDALAKVSQGRWPRAATEIQDGGAFLLLSIEKQLPSEVFDDKLRRQVAMELNSVVPSFKEHLYSWMVVFKNANGQVYESLLPSAR
jgi:hypothetical protein